MKRVLKFLVVTVVGIGLWAVFVVAATMGGWGRSTITEGAATRDFVTAAGAAVDSQFVGSFALAVLGGGVVEMESFHSAGQPVDRNTVFQVASMSKWVSALGVMALVERGSIDLDAPVSTYLTRWKLPVSAFDNQGVTVRRLLSHTAGIADGLGYSGFPPGVPVQSLEESLIHASDADEGTNGSVHVGIEPGSTFEYSGGGYTLLQLIVEEVTGQSFAPFMKDVVFGPLGMSHSSYEWDESSGFQLVGFYNRDGTKALHYRYTSLAATSLYASLADLETYFQMHLAGSNGEPIGRGVVTPETLRAMREPHGSTMGMDIWGLGSILFAETEGGDFIVGHDGQSTPAINTAIRLNPDTGDGIIVLTTGHPNLGTKLASEWVFWKTGKVDTLLFTMLADGMVARIGMGWMVILVLAIFAGILTYRRARTRRLGWV